MTYELFWWMLLLLGAFIAGVGTTYFVMKSSKELMQERDLKQHIEQDEKSDDGETERDDDDSKGATSSMDDFEQPRTKSTGVGVYVRREKHIYICKYSKDKVFHDDESCPSLKHAKHKTCYRLCQYCRKRDLASTSDTVVD